MKYLSILIFAILFLGCQDIKEVEKPKHLISQEVMVTILTDVYIGNASRSVNNKLLKEYNISLDSMIYNKYHIDSLQFVESNAYYSSNLETYNDIITKVQEDLIILQKEKDSIYEKIKKEKEDSTKAKKKEDSTKIKKKETPKLLANPIESEIN